jgi:AraC-like DNA-binding protein
MGGTPRKIGSSYGEAQFQVGYSLRQGTYNMKANHMHDSYEVYFLLSGQRKYFIRDRVYLIEKGDVVFVPKYDVHRTLDAGPHHERLLINFNDAFLESFYGEEKGKARSLDLLRLFRKDSPTLRLAQEDRHFVEALCFRMIKEVTEKPAGFELYLKALVMEMLVYLARCSGKYGEAVTPFDSPLHQKIAEIANYIRANYMKPLTLSHLSGRFYISTYYLSRAFKEISGFSFVEYLNHVRIQEAKRLLLETDWKVLKISEEVGFESIAHFGRVFKQMVHLSPMQYRRVQRSHRPEGMPPSLRAKEAEAGKQALPDGRASAR